MAPMLDAKLDFVFPAGKKISVLADAVTCRASTVDITAHGCIFTFGADCQFAAGAP
jgi:hypothetical protein